MSLIVTGSIGIDSVITPTGRANEVLGGSCTYFAAAASYFGPVSIVAAVGEDFPDEHMSVFDHFKIDTAGLEKRAGSKTFRWTGEYLENMNDRETRDVQINVLGEALPPVPDQHKGATYVFLANTHPAGQLELLNNFPETQLVVADTMDLWINTAEKELHELMWKIDGLVLNDSEAKLMTGESNMITASNKIREMGPKFVVVKKGEHGCLLNHAEGIGVMHAYPAANVVDPTGAGDSFAGGMMGYLAHEADNLEMPTIKRALAYGTIVASFNIEAFSLERMKEISLHDVNHRLDEFADCVRFD